MNYFFKYYGTYFVDYSIVILDNMIVALLVLFFALFSYSKEV